MKVLNYVICSTIILVGIVLFLSGEIFPTLLGLLWMVINMKMCHFLWYKNMWKSFFKTNLEIERYFGLE